MKIRLSKDEKLALLEAVSLSQLDTKKISRLVDEVRCRQSFEFPYLGVDELMKAIECNNKLRELNGMPALDADVRVKINKGC